MILDSRSGRSVYIARQTTAPNVNPGRVRAGCGPRLDDVFDYPKYPPETHHHIRAAQYLLYVQIIIIIYLFILNIMSVSATFYRH